MRDLQNSIAVTLVALLAAGFIPRVVAQIDLAVCDAGFTWMSNAEGQTPCHVAAYLISPCLANPALASVYSLIPTTPLNYYAAPSNSGTGLATNACNCNTVVYSLLAACGLCQLQTCLSWTQWEASCSTVYVAQYPEVIPSAVSVPSWAFLDVTKTGNNFSVAAVQAEIAKGDPDIAAASGGSSNAPLSHSTATAGTIFTTSSGAPGFTLPTSFSISVPTGFSLSLPTGLATNSPQQTNGADVTGSSSGKKSNVGAIVGGVVGGVGGLVVIVAAAWYFLTHRNKSAVAAASGTIPTTEAAYAPVAPGSPDPEKQNAALPPPVTDAGPELPYRPTRLTPTPPPLPEQQQTVQPPPSMVLYNPDDPSTFPDAQSRLSSIPTTQTPPSFQHTTPSPPPSGSNSGYVPTVF